ncbi:MAG: efflux RND transporter periplasmic adaptor subunit [Bacteroidales bacterium]|nr:efflux RND transporter periplasmic adaptor subunit [Bacteroidales bacterium]
MLLLASSCGKEDNQKAPTVKFETKVLHPVDRTYNIDLPATLQGTHEVKVYSQVSGTITSSKVHNGDLVQRGQVLYIIDQTPFRLAVQTAKANLSVAEAQMQTAKMQFESTSKLAAKGIVSDFTLNEARNNFSAASAAVAQARSQMAIAQTDLNHTVITAPCTGLVTTNDFTEGSMVTVGNPQQLCTVSENKEMEVKFSINEADMLALIREFHLTPSASGLVCEDGLPLSAKLPQLELKLKDGTTFDEKGTFAYISGSVDRATGTAQCIAKFQNAKGLLRTGLSANVVFPFAAKQVICIPQQAAVRIQDKYTVYIVDKDGKAQGVLCEVIPSNDGKEYFVVDGLKAGDEVVVNGARKLKNGDKIK